MTSETPVLASEVPHKPDIPFLQKWRSIGTGLGVEVGPQNLEFTLTVVRPNGIRIVDAFTVLRYRERPAAEWGSDLQAFLKKNAITHISAAVVLPMQDCISRSLALPGVPNGQVASAISYQLDGLHPFAEEEATHSFSLLSPPRNTSFALAIARNAVIEDYATLFDEAGIAVAAFLSPAAVIYSALRTLQLAPADQFIAIHEDTNGLIVYGETSTHPIYCVRFPDASDRSIASASAQIRLPDDAPVARLSALLPPAERLEISSTLSYAASLASALPSQSLGINLLPVDRRKTSSPWRWVPTFVLLILLMGLGLGFAYYQDYENQRLLTRLDAEISRLQPRLASIRALDTQILETEQKLKFLNTFATHPQQDLDSLRELTRIMPMTSYVSRMDLTRTDIGISGEIDQSMELLKMLDSSPFFKDSEFTSSPSRNQTGKELFQIRAKREFPSGAPVVPTPQNIPPVPRIAPPPPLQPGLRP
ncbi:MAG: hypothetical protein NTW74_08055 [Acidobacteria bacterium]|nr:hypothetical protein [Acidobacteriota bacterium]